MKAEEKLARQRLSVLELAETLGNVSEACRRRGMARSQFYEYERRLQEINPVLAYQVHDAVFLRQPP